jgi:hypothetical protein
MNKIFQNSKILIICLALTVQFFPTAVLAQQKAVIQDTQTRCKNYKDQFTLTNTGSSGQPVNIIGGSRVFCSASEFIIWIIGYVQVISGTVTALFLMIGGFLYVTSAGNEEQSEKGKKILINSIIGLVVIIMSYAIVRVVSSLVTLGK